MILLRFRSAEEHEELLRKVKRMKKFAEEIEDCLEDNMEDSEYNSRSGNSYRKDYDDEYYKRGFESRYSKMNRGGER